MKPGNIVKFEDGQKHHLAVLLSRHGDRAWALFLTSKPKWNSAARELRPRDLQSTGHVPGRDTWLAPVVRPVAGMSDVGMPGVGKEVLEELLHEFGPDPLVLPRCVEKLPSVRRIRPCFPNESILTIVKRRLATVDVTLQGGESLAGYLSDPMRFGMSAMFMAGLWPLNLYLTSWFVEMVPELETHYFIRRPSMTFALQSNWLQFGMSLKMARIAKNVTHSDIAAVLGVTAEDIVDFELGIQAPSWKEMLFLKRAYGGLGPPSGIPNQVPAWGACIDQARLWGKIGKIQSAARITRERTDRIITGAMPTPREEAGFRAALPWLPYWRPPVAGLDDAVVYYGGTVPYVQASIADRAMRDAAAALGIQVPSGLAGATVAKEVGRLQEELMAS